MQRNVNASMDALFGTPFASNDMDADNPYASPRAQMTLCGLGEGARNGIHLDKMLEERIKINLETMRRANQHMLRDGLIGVIPMLITESIAMENYPKILLELGIDLSNPLDYLKLLAVPVVWACLLAVRAKLEMHQPCQELDRIWDLYKILDSKCYSGPNSLPRMLMSDFQEAHTKHGVPPPTAITDS